MKRPGYSFFFFFFKNYRSFRESAITFLFSTLALHGAEFELRTWICPQGACALEFGSMRRNLKLAALRVMVERRFFPVVQIWASWVNGIQPYHLQETSVKIASWCSASAQRDWTFTQRCRSWRFCLPLSSFICLDS